MKFPDYERAWQWAARATLGLEPLRRRAGRAARRPRPEVLRDLADVAAALPYLDHDLSEAVLPRLTSGHDLGAAYRWLINGDGPAG